MAVYVSFLFLCSETLWYKSVTEIIISLELILSEVNVINTNDRISKTFLILVIIHRPVLKDAMS